MRLGSQACRIEPETRAAACYGEGVIHERHRHRYEFNPQYREEFARKGMIVSGLNPDSGLAEIVEIPDHPWFLAVQFHPEFKSKPPAAHPLFSGFVEAALNRQERRVELTA